MKSKTPNPSDTKLLKKFCASGSRLTLWRTTLTRPKGRVPDRDRGGSVNGVVGADRLPIGAPIYVKGREVFVY